VSGTDAPPERRNRRDGRKRGRSADGEAVAGPADAAPAARSASAPNYAATGVDLDYDEAFVDDIREITRSTLRPEILSSVGGFAGLFKTPERYENPIFVASADGVGTKLLLAAQQKRFDTVGIDCVAMCVNDLVVQGAEPLIFLDYIAMSRLDSERATQALRGIAEGCRRAGCALLGGETASMPGVYADGEIELVGFGVGVVERDRAIDGSSIGQGDVILGLASNGCHSNGYSLVRRIVDEGVASGRFDLRAENAELNTTLAGALLAPTRIYVKTVLNLMRDFTLKGLVHVTGGGFVGNVPRVLPKGVRARIDPTLWPRPAIFDWLQREGGIDDDEMLRVFNCGLGMLIIVPREQADDVIDRARGLGERAYRVGEFEVRSPDDPPLQLGPLRAR
jgi:phosphoribosylformylglycinamidine cyclo-ligase